MAEPIELPLLPLYWKTAIELGVASKLHRPYRQNQKKLKSEERFFTTRRPDAVAMIFDGFSKQTQTQLSSEPPLLIMIWVDYQPR